VHAARECNREQHCNPEIRNATGIGITNTEAVSNDWQTATMTGVSNQNLRSIINKEW
jgi:hypothetical protein